MVFRIIKEVRDISRFKEILTVLFEEGFEYLLIRIDLKHHIPLPRRIRTKLKQEKELKTEVMLRRTLERLGPTFIKLGQVLSVRPDLVPKEYSKELEKLQDRVPSFSFDDVKSVIEKDFGNGIDDLFLNFEKKPIASASISQVHKATLKSGEKVAVKVQRPNVKKLMETDIDIMFYIANLLEKHIDKIRGFMPVRVIR